MAHPSGGSTVRGERRRRRRGGSRRRWAPVSGGVGSGSCSTGEDGKGGTRPKLRGERGMWPGSPRMADDGGNGGVRRGPEPLGHRRWTGGIEGEAVEERAWHLGVDKGDGVKKGNGGGRRLLWWLGGATEWEGAGGSGVQRRMELKIGKRGGA
jgi:hypothetical protein